jgi:multiple sugar transport system substrate-binding protein
VALLAGCPSDEPGPEDRPEGMLPEGVQLTLLVVDDPALAAAIEQLHGEWDALTGSDYRVEQVSQGDLADGETPTTDAIIAPTGLLGVLAEKRGVVPVPKNYFNDEQGTWTDIFSLLRSREAVWGYQAVSVPFGSPVLTIYYRADLLEKLGRQPPSTWAEYQELAQLLSDRSKLGDHAPPDDAPWSGAIEPLGPGWAGLVLLARAAPYASHRENYSAAFDVDTMEPLIDGPPFVRALEELKAAAALGPPDRLQCDPTAARATFWQGQCGLAISWPTSADKRPAVPNQDIRVGFAELPGSSEAYDVGDRAWEPRREDEDANVPLLGIAGRMGVVTGDSKWPEATFRLLFWLSGEQANQVCTSSPATTVFRHAHAASPRAWVEGQMPAAAAARYAQTVEQALSFPQGSDKLLQRHCLFALRIPGRSDYLDALDEAVHQAVQGDETPQEALRQAAARWQEITEDLGREAQRQAYRNSLGLL